jgi:hypothetical protein
MPLSFSPLSYLAPGGVPAGTPNGPFFSQQWNTDGLLKGLALHRGACGGELLRAIDQENLVFAGGEPPGDDRSVVVATYRGKCSHGIGEELQR